MAIVKLPRLNKSNLDRPTQENLGASRGPDAGEEYIDVQSGGRQIPGIKDIGRLFTGLPFLLIGMVLSFIAVAWLFAGGAQQADRDSKYIEESSQLLMLSQRIAKDAREAVYGQEGAFPTLKDSRNTFEAIINNLTKGNTKLGILASPPAIAPALNNVAVKWKATRENVDQILGQEDAMLTLRDHVVGINQAAPLLLALTDEVVE